MDYFKTKGLHKIKIALILTQTKWYILRFFKKKLLMQI